jgi:indolepyruvate ferredoxin oxidoreductase alpha subunit
MGGARTIVTMKHVGVNVAADPLFTLSYTGVRGGLVLVVADDPEMHSSQDEQDSRHYARFAKVPMLEPADSQEALDFTRLAFEVSEKFDAPIMVRSTTRISHSKSVVETGEPVANFLKPGSSVTQASLSCSLVTPVSAIHSLRNDLKRWPNGPAIRTLIA